MNLQEEILYNFELISKNFSCKGLSDFKFWYLKNVGVNFYEKIECYKFYYSLKYYKFNGKKINILNENVFSFNAVYYKTLNQFIKMTNAKLLDISAKHGSNHTIMRFTLRIEQTKVEYDLQKFLIKMKLDKHIYLIQLINKSISEDVQSAICPLFAVGLDNEKKIPERVRLYFGFWPSEVLESWSNGGFCFHKNDKWLVRNLIKRLNVDLETSKVIEKIQNLMESNNAYLDFLGVDIDIKQKSFFKIYFRMTQNINVNMLNLIMKSSLLKYNKKEIDNCFYSETSIFKSLEMDCIAIKFSRKKVEQFQIYFK